MNRILSVSYDVPEHEVLDDAATVVLNGGVIVYPTETLYGIGADATNATAIRNVVKAKRRSDERPILVIIHSRDLLKNLVAGIPDFAEQLMQHFWPGPLTLVFKSAHGVPPELTRGSGTIGVRIPSNTFCLELLTRCNRPLTSTSANISGEPVHRTVDEIRLVMTDGIDLYIDAGRLPESKPSTVVSVVGKKPKLLREGVIPFDVLQEVLPAIEM
ncbi:MAG: threonylcarbamoyl-AMP synthase [Bacteroidetes bacterium]|nr:threonylcarbamoyl-AMP synthase [Bacteroidota bacterium]MCW5897396.1 threonylcarbamoyl-AMP synthase [Bacteroidota bacterium]